MPANEKITLKNATVGYKKSGGDIAILDHINLSFYEGDFVGIAGLNGTGKSTLLKSLCGLLPLLSGTLNINGIAVNELSLEALAKKVGIVLTERVGGFNLTAYDIVAAGQMPYTGSFNRLNAEHLAVIESAIDQCGIRNHRHKPANELSDGLFQKTVIAKALAQQTPILLLDEPSAFLDYASKHDLFLLLKQLAQQDKKCILVSSHDLDLVLKYCNKILLVSEKGAELLPVAEATQSDTFKKIGGGFI
ncbi:MAG: ABC transporter ATP-binding protein [Bacteroidota bacterium]